MDLIANKVQNFSKEDINKIEKEGTISIEINGKNINLGLQDV